MESILCLEELNLYVFLTMAWQFGTDIMYYNMAHGTLMHSKKACVPYNELHRILCILSFPEEMLLKFFQ